MRLAKNLVMSLPWSQVIGANKIIMLMLHTSSCDLVIIIITS